MVPWSRFALSLKPNVAYLALNFCALWKKQTTLPSLAYAGIPYHVLGARAGALALTSAWTRWAMARSDSGISAIFASTSLSPSAFVAPGPRRASALNSRTCSLIAARSSSVNPLTGLSVTLGLADFGVSFFGLMEPPSPGFGLPSHFVSKLHHAHLVGSDLRQMEGDVLVELLEERDPIADQDRENRITNLVGQPETEPFAGEGTASDKPDGAEPGPQPPGHELREIGGAGLDGSAGSRQRAMGEDEVGFVAVRPSQPPGLETQRGL